MLQNQMQTNMKTSSDYECVVYFTNATSLGQLALFLKAYLVEVKETLITQPYINLPLNL